MPFNNNQKITSGDNSFNVQISGDINISLASNLTESCSINIQEPYNPQQIFENNDFIWELGFGEISLLRPEQCAVSYHPEGNSILNKLLTWTLSDKEQILTKIICGPGGSGKTRLLQEASKKLKELGWLSGFIKTSNPENIYNELGLFFEKLENNCFLVLDYAESHPHEVKAILHRIVKLRSKNMIRVVFIARNAQGWWYEHLLKDKLIQTLYASNKYSGETVIEAIGGTSEACKSIYIHAISSYAIKLQSNYIPSHYDTPPDFLEETNGEPLYIHLAAIAYLRGEKPTTLQELLHFSLLRERSYWTKVLGIYGLGEAYWKVFFQIAAAITLLDGIDNDANILLIMNELPSSKLLTSEEKQKIKSVLFHFFRRGQGVDALRPDRLGEVLILEELALEPDLIAYLINLHDEHEKQQQILSTLERTSSKYVHKGDSESLKIINKHKNELFEKIYPSTNRAIMNTLRRKGFLQNGRLYRTLETFEYDLNNQAGINCSFITNILPPVDVHNRMKSSSIGLEQIIDILTIKVIADTESDCYLILGKIHGRFRPLPSGFYDYIASPTIKGYRGLHTCVRLRSIAMPILFIVLTKTMLHFSENSPASWLPTPIFRY